MAFDKIRTVTITQQTLTIFNRSVVCCFLLFFAQLPENIKKKPLVIDRRLYGIDNGGRNHRGKFTQIITVV